MKTLDVNLTSLPSNWAGLSVAALVIVKQVMSSSKADPWAGRTQAGPAGRDAGERAVHSPGGLKVRPYDPGGAYSSGWRLGAGRK